MELTLGFSPCPNDTFIFDALIHEKIDTEGLTFKVIMEDVEALNQRALNNELDITKLSYHAFAYCIRDYVLLNSGSALGNNCGPLLISDFRMSIDELKSKLVNPQSEISVAIPGKYTTANFLLQFAYPEIIQKQAFLFSEIEDAVLSGKVHLGVIIHENRFTYQEKGLKKIMDLGEYWEKKTGLPIPLGGIVAKRSLKTEIIQKIDRVLKRSIAFAFETPESAKSFIRENAQEMDEHVCQQHIDLYVNQFTLDLGETGKAAVNKLLSTCNVVSDHAILIA